MWICPNCEEEVTTLDYIVDTSATEFGIAYLNQEPPNSNINAQTRRPDDTITEHDSRDTEYNDWTDDPRYTCPDCNNDLTIRELIWKPNITNPETNPNTKNEEYEEDQYKIIKPQNQITRETTNSSLESSIICKECMHIYITGTRHNLADRSELSECPKCGTSNSHEEFNELLEKGYYNKTHKHAKTTTR